MFLCLMFYWRLCLLSALREVRLQVSLKVEVGKLVILGKLQKLGKLGISVDVSSVLRVLKLVLSDVSVDLLADIGSG